MHHTVDIGSLETGKINTSRVRLSAAGYHSLDYTVRVRAYQRLPYAVRIEPDFLLLSANTNAGLTASLSDDRLTPYTEPVKIDWSVSGGGTIDSTGYFTGNGEIGKYKAIAALHDFPGIADTAAINVAYMLHVTDGKGGTERLAFSANGRYVVFQGIRRATGWGFSLWEFEIYSHGVNAALGKPVSASSASSATLDPKYAVDGDLATRWSSVYADLQEFRVDLGQVMQIDSIVLMWDPAYAQEYKIVALLDTSGTTIAEQMGTLAPLYYGIGSAPNPFTWITSIRFSVPHAKNGEKQPLSIRIYDLSGKLVQTLAQGVFQAGYHTAAFKGRKNGNVQKLGNGIYFCRMQAPGFAKTLKLLLVE